MEPEGGAPRRADARRNRDRILDAARAALATGHDPSMQAVARAAGVGQGTLYRHFPTRDALVLALHREDVDELVAAAGPLLADRPPLDALRSWLELLAAYARVKRWAAAVLDAATRADLAAAHTGPVLGAIDLLLAAGREAGAVRPDVEARDVLVLVSFLWRDAPDLGDRADRLLTLVVDALGPRR